MRDGMRHVSCRGRPRRYPALLRLLSVSMHPTQGQTLFIPKRRSTPVVDRATTGLPSDLLNRAASRLQALAWLYAFTFFMAAFFPSLLFTAARQELFARALNWAPGAISIGVGLLVAWVIGAI